MQQDPDSTDSARAAVNDIPYAGITTVHIQWLTEGFWEDNPGKVRQQQPA